MTNDQHNPDADDLLVAELRDSFLRTDPVPPGVLAAARAAIEFRDIDAQIAELLMDSALEDKELAGVRGIGQRLLSFGLGERFLEVDVAGAGDVRGLVGYVVPAESGTLRVEGADGAREVPVDDQGRFRVDGLPAAPLRLALRVVGRPTFLTPWLTF